MDESGVGIDEMHMAEPRAAGIDVHKVQLTVILRLFQPGQARAPDASTAFYAQVGAAIPERMGALELDCV